MRTILITGGARGIGRAIADRFEAAGERVVVADLENGFDIGTEDGVRAAVEACGERIDVIVHNAGIGGDDWDRVIAVNLTAAYLLAVHGAPRMPEGGSMLLVSSTRALQSEPGTLAYSASKAGLLGLTHSLAVTFGPRIRVNAISPGWIHTGEPDVLTEADHAQHAAGRVGRPDDIAALAFFLASDDAGFITGQNHVVDGGMTVRMRYE